MKIKLLKRLRSIGREQVTVYSITKTNGMFIDVLRNGKSSGLADMFEIQKVSDDTPLSVASTQQVTETSKKEMGLSIAGFIGSAAGFGFAYYKKNGSLGIYWNGSCWRNCWFSCIPYHRS